MKNEMRHGALILKDRFPPPGAAREAAEPMNPAIDLYGRRFYKDQTPVEYLAEFLLVFASPKGTQTVGCYSLGLEVIGSSFCYWPSDRVALKLFSFFPSSKLETRHPAHQEAYVAAVSDLADHIQVSDGDKDETIRLVQSLFAGFVGVAKNRTWVTHSFLPASPAFLAREVNWLHSRALENEVLGWEDSKKFFATDRHNFMARGGELLFLQLANLFSKEEHSALGFLGADPSYRHLALISLPALRVSIETELRSILEQAVRPINALAHFVEGALQDYQLFEEPKEAPLGWVPAASLPEALLFATELNNISQSTFGALEKLDLLQVLCCMQVLRSLCFQARRFDDPDKCTDGFCGGYTWTAANPNAAPGTGVRKLAENSYEQIEQMLYRVLRKMADSSGRDLERLREADKHGFQIFRKIAKEIGLVIPWTGRGQRFVVAPPLLRFLVAALVAPGERVRLTEFYARVFAHYGIALGERQLGVALESDGRESGPKDYAVATDTMWIEEALQRGGFLVELSDAVSIVHNRGREEPKI